MPKKPLPQFNSHDEAVTYYKQYGQLIPGGKLSDFRLYDYHVRDGRKMTLYIYDDGRVVEPDFKSTKPTSIKPKPVEAEKEQFTKADLYKDGLCTCKANMKGKHVQFKQTDGRSFYVYMCIRCNKPVYY